MTNKRIRFRSQEYVLTEGGAIAAPEALENFTASFAHLHEDGRIMRHGKVIGRRDDIEVLGDSDVHATLEGLLRNAFNPEAWPALYGVCRCAKGANHADELTEIPPTRRIREGNEDG